MATSLKNTNVKRSISHSCVIFLKVCKKCSYIIQKILFISVEEITYGSINVPIAKKNSNQPSLSTIDNFEFSCCGRYLIVRHQIYPKVLWIWHISSDIVDLFFMENEISGMQNLRAQY